MITEGVRRTGARIVAHVSWWGAFAVTVLRVMELIPVTLGVIVVLLIGTGTAASLALSRMRLADTITTAFEAGMRVSNLADRVEDERRAEEAGPEVKR